MAQGRMLNKYISTSETVNNLSYEAMLVYTWIIPHTDDVGLIPRSPRKLKAIIAPMWDMTLETFGIQLETIVKAGLLIPASWQGEEFYYVAGHRKEQKFKHDRNPQSIASGIKDWESVKEIWDTLEPVGTETVPVGFPKIREEKISKEKLNTGDKRPEISETPVAGKPTAIGSLLAHHKLPEKTNEVSHGGITKEWQEKAFRWANDLSIKLESSSDKGRWLKVFKDAFEGRKSANLERAYSFLKDSPKFQSLDIKSKLNYFFSIYEKGLIGNFTTNGGR